MEETPSCWIRQIDGMEHAEQLHYMNSLAPDRFPALQSRHFRNGFWWIAQTNEGDIIGFAGLVPMVPFPGVGYLKRAYVLPGYRGHGLQLQFIRAREDKARDLGWYLLVSECANNPASERNFLTAGFEAFIPEQPWGESGSTYFRKRL